jgi:tRNA (guanosine-2'-O-)-methyltransferase
MQGPNTPRHLVIEDADYQTRRDFLHLLLQFISDNKKGKFDEIIKNRTRHITIVLEDIFQPHNASAVLRSCDCFGIQDVHIIENENPYEVNPDVALGSAKWLSLKKYNKETNNTPLCIETLKREGYTIVATTPHQNDFTPDTLPLDSKIALLFGTELQGLTGNAIEAADTYLRIPMVGFTESLNISVSAALLLYSLSERLRKSGINWRLSEDEELTIRLQWAKNAVRKSALIEAEFLKNLKKQQF